MSAPDQKPLLREAYGVFSLDRQEYAIEMGDLREVVEAPRRLLRMPLAPAYLLGLFQLRGQVIPVVDLRVLFGLDAPAADGESPGRMAVLQRGAASIGVLFDAVCEILRIAPGEVSAMHYGAEGDARPVKAVICRDEGRRVIQVLDLNALLSVKNMPAVEGTPVARSTEARTSGMGLRERDLFRVKLIGFTVGTHAMAIEMKGVVSLVDSGVKKESPRNLELCASIVVVQGRVVPVVKLAQLLQIDGSAGMHVLVCAIGDNWVGIEVDEVTGIIPFSPDRILPIPVLVEHRATVFHGCFTGVEGKSHIVLNVEGLLSRPEIREVCFGHGGLVGGEPVAPKNLTAKMPLLAFRLGKLYGLKLAEVVAVLEPSGELARTPETPSAVLGVLTLRGMPIPVLDPRPLFRIPPATGATEPKIVVLQDEGRRIAMQVDSVESIVSVDASEDSALPEVFFQGEKGKFEDGFARGLEVRGDGGRTIAISLLRARQIVERLKCALTG